MTLKRTLFLAACGPLLLTLAACQPPDKSAKGSGSAGSGIGGDTDSDPEFMVTSAGKNGAPGFTPQGWGWKPGSKVEISLFNEPDGQGKPNPSWKKILDETVETSTMFGFNDKAPFYPVRRTLCGNPPPRLIMLAMAKNTDTGKIRMRPLPVDLYFTFQPCPHSGAAPQAGGQPQLQPPQEQPPPQQRRRR